MQKQKQRRKTVLILFALLVIVVGLALFLLFKPTTTFTEPWTIEHSDFQLHEYDGENLVSPEEHPPINKSNKVFYNGKTYELKLLFDKPYISPIPSSEITGRIEIYEDGKKLNKLSEDLAMSPTRLLVHNYEDEPIFAVGLNLWLLMNTSGSVQIDNNNLKTGIYENSFSWLNGYDGKIKNWYNHIGENQPDFGVNQYHINSSFTHIYSPNLFKKAPRNTPLDPDVWLDISDGDAEFTFVYDGTRAQPFISFEVALKHARAGFTSGVDTFKDERGYLSTTKSLFFEDQFKDPIDVSDINKTNKTSFYYDVQTTPSQLTPGEPQTITLDITSKNKNGSINKSSYQRVLVRAYTTQNIFDIDNVVSTRRVCSDDRRTCGWNGYYEGIVEEAAFVGKTLRTSYGKFDGYQNKSQFSQWEEDNDIVGNILNFDDAVREFKEIFGELEDSGKNPDVIDSIDKLKAQLQLYPASEEETLEIIAQWKDKTKKYIENANINIPNYLNLEPNKLLQFITDGKVSIEENDLFSEFSNETAFSANSIRDPNEPEFIHSNLITIPLIDGKASISYQYNGLTGHQPIIIFHVSPVDSYIGLRSCYRQSSGYSSPFGDGTEICLNAIDSALKALPPRPDDLEMNSLSKTLLISDYILYGKWLKPTSPELGAYTIIGIPIGSQATSQFIDQTSRFIQRFSFGETNSNLSLHLIWFISLQLVQLIFGGTFLICKRKHVQK